LRKTPFFAENWQKSQKIVIITSTPGHPENKFRNIRLLFPILRNPIEKRHAILLL
jgi:hypothetical protein